MNWYLAEAIQRKADPKKVSLHRTEFSPSEIASAIVHANLKKGDKVVLAGLPDVQDGGAACNTSLVRALDEKDAREVLRDKAVYLAQPEAYRGNKYGGLVVDRVDQLRALPINELSERTFTRMSNRLSSSRGLEDLTSAEAAALHSSIFNFGDMLGQTGMGGLADNLLELVDHIARL